MVKAKGEGVREESLSIASKGEKKKEQEGKRSILFTDISEGCEDGKGKEITEDTEN